MWCVVSCVCFLCVNIISISKVVVLNSFLYAQDNCGYNTLYINYFLLYHVSFKYLVIISELLTLFFVTFN